MIRILFFHCASILVLSIAQLSGAVLAYESFKDETVGGLNYQTGGFGFRGHWGAVDWPEGWIPPDKGQYHFTVASGALSSGYTSYANRVRLAASTTTNCEIKRKLAYPICVAGTTNYLRFVMRADYPSGSLWPSGKYFGLELRSGASSRLYVGKGVSGSFAIGKAAGLSYVAAPEALVANTTYMLVLKVDSRAGNDRVTLYVNPSTTEPASSATREDLDIGECDLLSIVSNFSMSLDEIVVADTFAEAVNPGIVPVAPVISVVSTSRAEGDAWTNSFPIVAQLSEPVPRQVSVNWSTFNGTATLNTDYLSGSGVLVFPPGSSFATGVVSVLGDLEIEQSESFYIGLSWPVSAQLGGNDYCWILNDDAAPPVLSILNSNSLLHLSWSANRTNFLLEAATSPAFQSTMAVTNVQQTFSGGGIFRFRSVQTNDSANVYYRLRRPL